MCYLKINIIYAFISCSLLFVFANNDCLPDDSVEDFNWETTNENFADITLHECNNPQEFLLYVYNIKDDVYVTVYVDPYVNASTNCTLKKPLNSRNLYKFYNSMTYKKGTNGPIWSLPLALSGCYYIKLTNTKGDHLIQGIDYYFNKSTPFYDWNLSFGHEQTLTPGNVAANITSKLTLQLKIPLTCVKIIMQLFQELRGSKPYEKELIGECSFTNVTKSEKCSLLKPGLGFKVNKKSALPNSENWNATIIWDNLPTDVACYSSQFDIVNINCKMEYEEVMTWKPAYKFNLIRNIGIKGPANKPPPTLVSPTKWIAHALGIFLVLILAIILIYWIQRWMKASFGRNNDEISSPEQKLESIAFSDSEILLMYVRGSPDMKKKIMYYRNCLKKKCQHQVYDIYSLNKSTIYEDIGVVAWVEKMMKVNSKFVWFDTPEFRSFLINDADQKDHRDTAIPYAIKMTKIVFQNLTDQYRHHFVVRLEGFDVTDDKEDPLLVISPGIRYHLPQHFDALCNDLNK